MTVKDAVRKETKHYVTDDNGDSYLYIYTCVKLITCVISHLDESR